MAVYLLRGGEYFAAKTVIWSAGCAEEQFNGLPQKCCDNRKKFLVDDNCRVMHIDDVYAIGSCSVPHGGNENILTGITGAKSLNLIPRLQQVAHQRDVIVKVPHRFNDKQVVRLGRFRAATERTNHSHRSVGRITWMISLFHLFQFLPPRGRLIKWIHCVYQMWRMDIKSAVIVQAGGALNGRLRSLARRVSA